MMICSFYRCEDDVGVAIHSGRGSESRRAKNEEERIKEIVKNYGFEDKFLEA